MNPEHVIATLNRALVQQSRRFLHRFETQEPVSKQATEVKASTTPLWCGCVKTQADRPFLPDLPILLPPDETLPHFIWTRRQRAFEFASADESDGVNLVTRTNISIAG